MYPQYSSLNKLDINISYISAADLQVRQWSLGSLFFNQTNPRSCFSFPPTFDQLDTNCNCVTLSCGIPCNIKRVTRIVLGECVYQKYK